MAEAVTRGITFDSFEEGSRPALLCSLTIEEESAADDLLALTALNFALPLLVLIILAIFAVILHLSITRRNKNQVFGVSENIESMNGSVYEGKDDLEKAHCNKAAEKDYLEEPEFCLEPSALKLPGPPSSHFGLPHMEESMNSETLVLLPVKEIANSRNMLDTMRDLQCYQNNLIEKIMAEEKKEK
jgi:hypothetical protein